MKTIELVIYTPPVAKGRPKFSTVNGHAQAYTPARTRNAEAEIQALIRQEVMAQGSFEAGVPLKLIATFYRQRPKSCPKRVTMPVTKPDVENYGKLLLDALNAFAFADDAQVTTCYLKKRFCKPGQVPRIELMITEDEE